MAKSIANLFQRREAGLTRLEFLVTILVVLILVIMMLIVMGPGGGHLEMARRAQCMNNLRKIGRGLMTYSDEAHFGAMPAFSNHDDTEEMMAKALGLLYGNGEGLVADPRIFVCPSAKDYDRDKVSDRLARNDPIDSDAETSYSLSTGLSVNDRANKVIAGDEGDGAGKGQFNHKDGQNVLYRDGHMNFTKTDNPKHDADPGSIYQDDGGGERDTHLF